MGNDARTKTRTLGRRGRGLPEPQELGPHGGCVLRLGRETAKPAPGLFRAATAIDKPDRLGPNIDRPVGYKLMRPWRAKPGRSF